MKTVWIKGLNVQEKEEMQQSFRASAALRERLTTLLNERVDANREYARSKDRYESPSWNQLQADSLGYERALFEVISLISSKDV